MDPDDQLAFYRLKSELLFNQGQFEDALNLAQQLYRASTDIKNPLMTLSAFFTVLGAQRKLGRLQDCLGEI